MAKKKKMKPSEAASARWDAPDPAKAHVEYRKNGFDHWLKNNGIKGLIGMLLLIGTIAAALFVVSGLYF